MDEKFLAGIVLGMLGGALIVTNSVKARQLVKDGQERVVKTVEELDKQSKQKQ
jgi:phage terminase large subunit-like protein